MADIGYPAAGTTPFKGGETAALARMAGDWGIGADLHEFFGQTYTSFLWVDWAGAAWGTAQHHSVPGRSLRAHHALGLLFLVRETPSEFFVVFILGPPSAAAGLLSLLIRGVAHARQTEAWPCCLLSCLVLRHTHTLLRAPPIPPPPSHLHMHR